MSRTLRIAMWSGPRNISTAMMRAWENRPDCEVVDEPFYAAYLAITNVDHPGRDEILAAGETDWRKVVPYLLGPPPGEQAIWYQKQMGQHLLPGMDVEWIHEMVNVFLIRNPKAVVASFVQARKTESIRPEEIGLIQQARLFDAISKRLGEPPPVIDSGEFLQDPEGHLRTLCRYLKVPFFPAMLTWPKGSRPSDGVWGPYWYDTVRNSTGFEKPIPRQIELSGQPAAVADYCQPLYERLFAHRLQPERKQHDSPKN